MSDETRCCKRVYDSYSLIGHPCTRKVWKDGFCKTHHPETVKARQEESTRRYKEKWDNSPINKLGKRCQQFESALRTIHSFATEPHNADIRKMCEDALKVEAAE